MKQAKATDQQVGPDVTTLGSSGPVRVRPIPIRFPKDIFHGHRGHTGLELGCKIPVEPEDRDSYSAAPFSDIILRKPTHNTDHSSLGSCYDGWRSVHSERDRYDMPNQP